MTLEYVTGMILNDDEVPEGTSEDAIYCNGEGQLLVVNQTHPALKHTEAPLTTNRLRFVNPLTGQETIDGKPADLVEVSGGGQLMPREPSSPSTPSYRGQATSDPSHNEQPLAKRPLKFANPLEGKK